MIEREIKAALIDRLVERGDLAGNAVVVNEMAVAGKERRADLVVANGKLQAFEIKSDADNLDRLKGQIGTFRAYFDKTTIVCGLKHAQPILDTICDRVEVWVISSQGTQVRWRQARRGVTEPVSDRERILSFLPKKDAIRALRSAGLSCSWDTPRTDLIYWAKSMSVIALKKAVLAYVKSRYADVNREFMRRRRRRGTRPSHIDVLSLYRDSRCVGECPMSTAELNEDVQARAAAHPRAINITARFGPRGEGANPIYIIPKG